MTFESQEAYEQELSSMLKIPIARLGAWEHPAYDYVVFTQKDFDDIKRNFEKNEWGFEPYLRYGHAKYKGAADGEPATAFLDRVSQEKDVLFGYFNAVDPTVVDEIKTGKYRYASAELTRNANGKKLGQGKIGTVLTAVSLTNAPFVPGLPHNEVLSNNPPDEHYWVLNMREIPTMPQEEHSILNKLSNAVDSLVQFLSNNPFSAKGGDERHGSLEKLDNAPLMPGLKELCLSMKQAEGESDEAYTSRMNMVLCDAFDLYMSMGKSEDAFKDDMKQVCSMMQHDEELEAISQKFTASIFTDTPVYKNGVLVKGKPNQDGLKLSMHDVLHKMSNDQLMEMHSNSQMFSSAVMSAVDEELSFRQDETQDCDCGYDDCPICGADESQGLSDGFVPPENVRSAARRGLELRKKFGRGGLSIQEASKQGIGSGVARARDLSNGSKIPMKTIKRMRSFFARHAKDKAGGAENGDRGAIAWLLWGGDAGKSWADSIVKREEKLSNQRMASESGKLEAMDHEYSSLRNLSMGAGDEERYSEKMSDNSSPDKSMGLSSGGFAADRGMPADANPEMLAQGYAADRGKPANADPELLSAGYAADRGKAADADPELLSAGYEAERGKPANADPELLAQGYAAERGKPADADPELLAQGYAADRGKPANADIELLTKSGHMLFNKDDFDAHDADSEELSTLKAKARNALDSEQFAVPGKRKLPIHDANHVRAALSRFNQTKGLSPEEKQAAMGKIRAAAKKFGVEVSEHHTASPMTDTPVYKNGVIVKGHEQNMSMGGGFDLPTDRGSNGKETKAARPMPPHHPEGSIAFLTMALSNAAARGEQLSNGAAGAAPSASITTHEEGKTMPEVNDQFENRLGALEQKLSTALTVIEAQSKEKADLEAKLAGAEQKLSQLAEKAAESAVESYELKLSQRAEAAKRNRIPPVLVDEVVDVVRNAGFEQKLSMGGNEAGLADLLFGLLDKLPEENRVNFNQLGAKQVLSQNAMTGDAFAYDVIIKERLGQ